MPRAPRIEFAGAIYHVMNRGDRFEKIFGDDKDREIFLKTLGEACESSGWVVHSFVLMRNHYHLLLETSRASLVKGMQYLNSTYTRRYNVRHKSFGHLFQGRYKALLVDSEAKGYFLTVSDYVHLNPIRAKKIREAKDFFKDPWSSVGWLAGSRKGRPDWLRWERVYGELGLTSWRSRSRREFREYMKRRVQEVSPQVEGWKKIRRGWCLGSEGFVNEMKERLEELGKRKRVQGDSWSGVAVDEREEDLAREVLARARKKLKIDDGASISRMDAYLLARWTRSQTKVGVKWLAQELKILSVGTLSYGIWKIGSIMESNRNIKQKWKTLQY
jgi:putative transposase